MPWRFFGSTQQEMSSALTKTLIKRDLVLLHETFSMYPTLLQ